MEFAIPTRKMSLVHKLNPSSDLELYFAATEFCLAGYQRCLSILSSRPFLLTNCGTYPIENLPSHN